MLYYTMLYYIIGPQGAGRRVRPRQPPQREREAGRTAPRRAQEPGAGKHKQANNRHISETLVTQQLQTSISETTTHTLVKQQIQPITLPHI